MPSSTTTVVEDLLVVGTAGWVDPISAAIESTTGAAVRIVRSVDAATDARERKDFDCVVSGCELEGGTGLELVRTLQSEASSPPIVLCTADGDEQTATEAFRAGAADYIPISDEASAAAETVLERVRDAVHEARRAKSRADRARQFETVFQDAGTATWILDPEGRLERANEAARTMLDGDTDDLVGDPLWTLPWWDDSERSRTDVRELLQAAIDRRTTERVVRRTGRSESRTIELTILPVEAENGDLLGLVVIGDDVTERVSLYRELRSSEELHRVTLNNMTDTVLLTDDDGRFTYVCPNVHFIFGYTAEEIQELGTIDELLGSDLFDREELTSEGVLKNIECTISDKGGREHTLLVNVREVSIQDGTLLYSCRDVTKRKRREDALATLQKMARDFLYTGTSREIAQQVVDDVPGVLDLDAGAVYLFDADGNELEPVAWSAEMERLNGPLPTVGAHAETLVSHTYVEAESLYFDDVHAADRLENRATDLRSTAYVPLGDHGVFVGGSAEVGRFDEVTRELTDLLAATAEAALDRVRRERTLREQERELQRRNEQLTALNRINEIIRDIDQALVEAETREEIEHAVCERLTADSRFGFAWIGVLDAVSETVEPRAWAGDGRGYLDSVSISVADDAGEPSGRTAATREETVIPNVSERLREEPWRKEALSREYLSVLSVPIAYDEFTYGVLTVYANTRNAFDETARTVFAELGETIASATSAIERKNALLTTSMTRIEFRVDDPSFVLSRLARAAECEVTYQGGIQQTATGSNLFVSVDGASVEAVERAAADLVAIDAVDRIGTDGEGVLRLGLTEPFLALELADHGAVLRTATVSPDVARLVVDVPDSVDARNITQLVTETFDDVTLASKQSVDRSPARTLHSDVLEELTDRQLEVMQTAYYSGFFESPRESTGEEVADSLGISPPAFYRHARTVQRKLFSALFDDGGVRPTEQT